MCIADIILKTNFGFIVAENSCDNFYLRSNLIRDVIDYGLKNVLVRLTVKRLSKGYTVEQHFIAFLTFHTTLFFWQYHNFARSQS